MQPASSRQLKELLDLFEEKEVPETGHLLALEDRKPPSKEGRHLRPKEAPKTLKPP